MVVPSTLNMAHRTVEFDQLVKKTIDEWNVPGLSIAIVQGGDIFAKVVLSMHYSSAVAHCCPGLRPRQPSWREVQQWNDFRLG